MGLSYFQVSVLIQLRARVDSVQQHPDPENNKNLGVILLEFLELYGIHFNYGNVCISVTDGGKYFPKVCRPAQKASAYCRHLQSGAFYNERKPLNLAIENPRAPGEDVTKGSYQIAQVEQLDASNQSSNCLQVQQSFEHAYYVLSSAFSDSTKGFRSSILSRILEISEETLSYRKWLSTTFAGSGDDDSAAVGLSNGSLQLSGRKRKASGSDVREKGRRRKEKENGSDKKKRKAESDDSGKKKSKKQKKKKSPKGGFKSSKL